MCQNLISRSQESGKKYLFKLKIFENNLILKSSLECAKVHLNREY